MPRGPGPPAAPRRPPGRNEAWGHRHHDVARSRRGLGLEIPREPRHDRLRHDRTRVVRDAAGATCRSAGAPPRWTGRGPCAPIRAAAGPPSRSPRRRSRGRRADPAEGPGRTGCGSTRTLRAGRSRGPLRRAHSAPPPREGREYPDAHRGQNRDQHREGEGPKNASPTTARWPGFVLVPTLAPERRAERPACRRVPARAHRQTFTANTRWLATIRSPPRYATATAARPLPPIG